MTAKDVEQELKTLANPTKAKFLQKYFKTEKGGYGHGDIFLGITVPLQRNVAKKFQELELSEVQKLLQSNIHEHRFVALEILVFKYEKAKKFENKKEQKKIGNFYLKHKNFINNWDLVDTSAPYILGNWLLDKDRKILYKLVNSKNIWHRRIAVISTFAFIKNKDFTDTFKLTELLLQDSHDLIHKATGWMLREVGNKSQVKLEKFLRKYSKKMPRTMLRYAIEKLPESKRKAYLKR